MQRHFEQELDNLKSMLIKMGSLAEQAIQLSIDSMLKQDKKLAQEVIDADAEINSYEIRIDKAIVDLLALQQPVASDLRLILSAAKINSNLERIGDHAVNVAESALLLSEKSFPQPPFEDVSRMTGITKRMLSDALDSFVHSDADIGEAVVLMDDAVDNLNRKITKELAGIMKSDPETIEPAVELTRVSRNLERVADLATNIAEEVVFIAKAKFIKHHAADHFEM
jgi:phosphate transport system protein